MKFVLNLFKIRKNKKIQKTNYEKEIEEKYFRIRKKIIKF
jgi:hypothetical protein